jgi:Tol biopolymer transport system component/mono/diheme cytochrome c family protein
MGRSAYNYRLAFTFMLFVLIVACSAPQSPTQPSTVPAAAPATELSHAPRAFDVAVQEIGPLPTDEASLLEGRRLYVESCVVCHGAAGDGNGEYSLSADAPPVPDLRSHMAPGVHSDALIAAWIRDGIPGTSMPGYGLVLGDEGILQLTAYLRTFAQENPLVGVDPAALATEQARPPTPTPIPDVSEQLPKLAFIRGNELWYSAGDSSPARSIFSVDSNTLVQAPTFAPDGTRIAYLTITLPQDGVSAVVSAIHLMNNDGSAQRMLWTSTGEQPRAPVWAPDGTGIYVTLTRSEPQADGSFLARSRIVQIDLASGALTPFLENGRDLTLSSDGERMVYVRQGSDGAALELVLADRSGQNEQIIAAPEGSEELAAPRFAPDGQSVLVTIRGVISGGRQGGLLSWLEPPPAYAHGSPWDVWAFDVERGSLQRLTFLNEDEPHAAFSPDSKEIILLGVTGLYRLNSDGSQLRRIDPQGGYGGIDWGR